MNEIIVKKNQRILLPILWIGSETDLSYTINLSGSGASTTIFALLLGKREQNVKIQITVLHSHPETKSNIVVKSVLQDGAQMHFNGLVHILHGAKGAKAHLAAHVLLLSDKAKGEAIPGLEIAENDVQAGHATTIGRISDLQLFYLMSRGLSEQTAKKLIVEGFLEDILEKLPDKLAHRARKVITNF